MKLLIKHFSVLILLLFIPGISQANFCHKDTTDRAKEEAGQIKFEDFAKSFPGETVDYLGQRSYNADIISCNRKRDNKSGDIEGAISAKHKFPGNLESRTVKGHYNYYSTAPLRYAYEIRHENGEWIVTIPMRFHWPTSRKTDMIDISMERVNELSDANLSRICDPVNRVMDNNGNTVKVGRIPHEGTTDTNNVENKDTHFDGPACRVRRTLDVNGTNIRRHLRHFYANSLKRVRDRPLSFNFFNY